MKDDITPPPNKPDQPLGSANSPQTNPPQTVNDVIQAPRPVEAASDTNEPTTQQATEPASPEQAPQTPKEEAPKPKKKRGNGLIIGSAIVIMLALTGIAVYVGLITKDDSSNGSTQNNQTSSSKATEDKKSLDGTLIEIDALPDDSDSSGNTLNDQDLGL